MAGRIENGLSAIADHSGGTMTPNRHAPPSVLSLFLLVAILLLPVVAHASTGAVHVFVGQKFLGEDEWEPVEHQLEVGIDAAMGGDSWPIWINFGILAASADDEIGGGDQLEGSTMELYAGINKTWTGNQFHPYVSGGFAFVNSDVEVRDVNDDIVAEDDDSGPGLYVQGGGYWRVGSSLNLGGMLRYSVFGDDFEGGGVHLGVTIGWGWPKRNY